MTTSPFLSIVVPVYNASRFLAKCIKSIICQSFNDFELILVDDGSTDGSSEICDKYINDNRCPVIVIHKENQGVTEARIAGYKKASGKYIMFIDADDYLSTDALDVICNMARTTCADVIVAQYNISNEKTIYKTERTARKGIYNKAEIIELLRTNFLFDKECDKSGFPLYLWGKIYKKGILKDIIEKSKGFWYGEDIICMLGIIERAESMYIMEDYLYNYTFHDGQITRNDISKLWPEYVKVWEYIKDYDTKHFFNRQLPERIWSFCCSKLLLSARQMSRKEFSETYNVVRQPDIVKQLVLDKNSIIQGPANNMYKFFMRNGWRTVHYWFLHYGIIERIKRLIK